MTVVIILFQSTYLLFLALLLWLGLPAQCWVQVVQGWVSSLILTCRAKTSIISLSGFSAVVLCRYLFQIKEFLFYFYFALIVMKGWRILFRAFLHYWADFIIFLYSVNGWIARIVTNLVTLYCTLCISGFDLLILGFLHSWIWTTKASNFLSVSLSGFDIRLTLMLRNNLWRISSFSVLRKFL